MFKKLFIKLGIEVVQKFMSDKNVDDDIQKIVNTILNGCKDGRWDESDTSNVSNIVLEIVEKK